MSEVVSAVLAKAAEEEALLGSTVVNKPIEPELDLGHMLAIDPNQTEFSEEKVSYYWVIQKFHENDILSPMQMPSEEDLMELGRDCAQLLINSLWQVCAASLALNENFPFDTNNKCWSWCLFSEQTP